MNYIDETTVLDFYLSQIERDKIKFLEDRDELKEEVRENVVKLRAAGELHEKIEVAKKLWKALFKASMSYIDSDMRGYDELFKYFDEYVNFEELIFASDSFYRDHTMHCLWVYFLGEYLYKKEEFKEVFKDYNIGVNRAKSFAQAIENCDLTSWFPTLVEGVKCLDVSNYDDSIRCVAALTHDLGYPIKKINKVNKCISKILPYFSFNNYNEFNFSYNIVQQGFIENFIAIMSRSISYSSNNNNDKIDDEAYLKELIGRVFEKDEKDNLKAIREEELKKLNKKELEDLKSILVMEKKVNESTDMHMRYYNDIEQYQHGIMSAFLLMKTLKAFSNIKFTYTGNRQVDMSTEDINGFIVKYSILTAISDHTSDGYRISDIVRTSNFLILIDELEEFSRISRANMNRQYIEEICKSAIYYEDGVLNIDFVFDNQEIANLDPEKAFKGRCKRFIELFDIKKLNESLKIRLRCIGKLSYDENVYTLEIRRKYANILINGEEQNIPKYLKSSQFYTKEMYMKL